jgi:insertion element IS1 protein InsB
VLCFGGVAFVAAPFNIVVKVYVDGNYVYEKIRGVDKVKADKRNTQKIERKHTCRLRTWVKRLARKIICFSKFLQMHKTVVGLCINVKIFKRPLIT